jgi:putative copper resistance protein D
MTLAFEALTVGGFIFLVAIARKDISDLTALSLSRFLTASSVLLAVTQIVFVGATSAVLMHSADLTWAEVRGAGFSMAGVYMIAGAALVGGSARNRYGKVLGPVGCILILYGTVTTSHSAARLEHRGTLACLTFAHHFGSAHALPPHDSAENTQ